MNNKQVTRRAQGRPSLLRDQRGLSTVEYVVLLVLICAGCVGMWQTFGKELYGKLSGANTTFGDTVDSDKITEGGDDND